MDGREKGRCLYWWKCICKLHKTRLFYCILGLLSFPFILQKQQNYKNSNENNSTFMIIRFRIFFFPFWIFCGAINWRKKQSFLFSNEKRVLSMDFSARAPLVHCHCITQTCTLSLLRLVIKSWRSYSIVHLYLSSAFIEEGLPFIRIHFFIIIAFNKVLRKHQKDTKSIDLSTDLGITTTQVFTRRNFTVLFLACSHSFFAKKKHASNVVILQSVAAQTKH